MSDRDGVAATLTDEQVWELERLAGAVRSALAGNGDLRTAATALAEAVLPAETPGTDGTITAGYGPDGDFWAVETCDMDMTATPDPDLPRGRVRVGQVPDGPGRWLLVRHRRESAWVRDGTPATTAELAALGVDLDAGVVVRSWPDPRE
jgi:hypothetical protein